MAFLNAVLSRTGKDNLQSVEIIENRNLPAEVIGDKTSILDVRAKTSNGTKVNIEVQLSNLSNMDKRSLFYWSRDFSKSLEAGQDYLELPAVININIVKFEFLPVADFHASFHLWEDHNRECMLTDALEIHFIDMVKFKRMQEKDITNNPLHRWLIFFDKNANDKTLKEIINMDTAIQKAQERITFVSKDKESLRAYDMREMALSDYTSGMNFARREGHREASIKAALKLARRGMNVVEIADITDLSIEEVKKILKTS